MKLGIVIPGYQSDASDWCIPAFTNLAHELAKRDEVHVFALRYPPRRDDYQVGEVHVHAVGAGAFGSRRLPLLSLLNLWKEAYVCIRKEHAARRFDALMGIWATESGWLAVQTGMRLGIPSLVHLAGGELVWLPAIRYGNAASKFERFLVDGALRGANRVTCPSGAAMRRARQRGVPASELCLWPLGVGTSLFSPNPAVSRADVPLTFVTAGSLIPVKDHAWLIEAMARLVALTPHTPFCLKIAGDGPLRSELLTLVGQKGLQGYVDFLGEVPHDHLPDLFRSADCFVLTSRYEAQCMAVLEAMSCGVPWIGPPVGALADIGSDPPDTWPSGILVRERSVEALAQGMLRMLQAPPGLRREMGIAARKRILQTYSIQTQVENLRGILNELTPDRAAARIRATGS